MNGFHGQLHRAKDDLSLKCCHRSKVARLGKAAIEWERERWKMASINFPRGDLHAFIKHEEEIGRDVFLSLSLIIFTLMCKATFFFAPSSRLWLVSIGQYFEFSRQNLVWITCAKWDFFGYFSNSVFGKPWFCCCRLEERLGRARFSEENTNGQFCLCLA